MTTPDPQPSINLPSPAGIGPWFTVNVGAIRHTISLAHVVQLTESGGPRQTAVHLSNGQHIVLDVKDSLRLEKLLGLQRRA
jgi:hypothetical protein